MNGGWSIVYAARRLVVTQYVVILIVALIGVLGGVAYGLKEPVNYSASATVVTGTYSLPQNLGITGVIDKTGALGLEMPAETQAMIISSPVVTDAAAKKVGLTGTDAAAMAQSVNAKPATDNSFIVSVKGPNPSAAADYTNAVAESYLAYRKDRGKASLQTLVAQYNEQSDTANAAAKSLDARIRDAGGPNTQPGAQLVARQQDVLKQADTAKSTAASLGTLADDFNGGGSILERANSGKVNASPGLLIYAGLGLVAGLALGVVIAAVRRQFSARLTDRVDVVRTLDDVPVFAERGANDAALGAMLWRAIQNSQPESARSHGKSVAVLPLTREHTAEVTAAALESAAHASGRGVAVVSSSEIGSFGSPENSTIEVFVAEPALGRDRGGVSLPHGFTGAVVLSVMEGKDTSDSLFEIADQLHMAGLDIAAVSLVRKSSGSVSGKGGRRVNTVPASETEPSTFASRAQRKEDLTADLLDTESRTAKAR